MLYLRRPAYFKLSDKIECEIWLAREAGKDPLMMSVQGGCWLWRRIFDITKQSAGITSLHGLPMAGHLPGAQPETCRTSSVRITEGPRTSEWFDLVDHLALWVPNREAGLAPKKNALNKLAANLEHDGGPKTDCFLFKFECCDSRTCDVVRSNRFQAMHRALRLLIKQPDVNVESLEFSCMMVGVFGISNYHDFEVYVG